MNIIFIIVDAMRWDYLGYNGYPRPTTPNLDEIAEGSCVFNRAYAAINQTDMCLTSIFSGYYPLTHGLQQTAASTQLDELNALNVWKIKYLPQYLKEAGFFTVGMDWLDRWHRWGYDWYSGQDDKSSQRLLRRLAMRFPKPATYITRQIRKGGGVFASAVRTKPGTSARVATDKALMFLKQSHGKNILLMLHYWDVHTPYSEHPEYLHEMQSINISGEDQDLRSLVDNLCHNQEYKDWAFNDIVQDNQTTGDLVARFCASLRYVDEQIGRIFCFLKEQQILDETILVVTADHGENLFENGYFIEHSDVPERVMHVPLLVHFPGINRCQVNEFISHVDLLPTLMDYLGIESTSDYDGRSLLPLLTSGRSFNRECVLFQSRTEQDLWGIYFDNSFKYVERRGLSDTLCQYCGEEHNPARGLYNLDSDPHTKINLVHKEYELADKGGAILNKMVNTLNQKKDGLSNGGSDRTIGGYTSEEQDALDRRFRDLGYID